MEANRLGESHASVGRFARHGGDQPRPGHAGERHVQSPGKVKVSPTSESAIRRGAIAFLKRRIGSSIGSRPSRKVLWCMGTTKVARASLAISTACSGVQWLAI